MKENKQSQGSKKKARKKEFLERERKRIVNKFNYEAVKNANNIEEMAKAIGLKLK